MAAYLRFYQFEKSPFESTAAKQGLVLGTKSLKGAFGHVKQGLEEDSPRICLSGSAGVGKTSFCRALPKLLADSAQTVVVLDPCRPWQEIRNTIAKKLKLSGAAISRKALMAAKEESKQLVLVIDQAEALSHESLDHLDILLQYKCDDGKQLLHCVMLANLEAASTGAEIPLLWWLDKFTTMQLQFSPIPAEGIRHYVEKHLAKAGWAGGELFTKQALAAIHCNTGGLPRAINELCEKILIEGGARAITSINGDFIEELCGDGKPQPTIDRDAADPDLSAQWSIGDANDSPNAQDLLDTASSDQEQLGDPEIGANRDQLLGESQDIASLLVTQDSPEVLRVEPHATIREESSSTLELEVEPGPSRQQHEESFYGQKTSIGAPIGMGRIPIGTQSKKRRSGMMMLMLVLALIAYVINSKFSVPTELIESAEGKIAETLEKRKSLVSDQEAEPTPEPIVESSLSPSILDRADEIAADEALEHDPDTKSASELDEPMSANELAAVPGTDTNDTAQSRASNSSKPATPKAPATIPTTPTPAVAKTSVKPAPATTKPSSSFSNDLMIVNEYTAIPEAASSAPKLPHPAPVKPNTRATTREASAAVSKTAAKPVSKKTVPPAVKKTVTKAASKTKPKLRSTRTTPAKISTDPIAAPKRAKPEPAQSLEVQRQQQQEEDEWTIDW
jgi:type II secretory pathway predicted ATPase ExeA